MSNPLIQEINVETGNSEVREMTNEEFEELKNCQKIANEHIRKMQIQKEAKADLLAKLGITEDEAKLLLSCRYHQRTASKNRYSNQSAEWCA